VFVSRERGQYVATAIISIVMFALWLGVDHFLMGNTVSLDHVLPMALIFVALMIWIPYRRIHQRDPAPAWLRVGIGMLGVAVYTFWLLTDGRTFRTGDWVLFSLIAAVPVILLISGVRLSRKGAATVRGADPG
jgi:hypothetical protein